MTHTLTAEQHKKGREPRERIRATSRAAVFTSKSQATATILCRELVSRGIFRERFWVRGAPLLSNTFRTYIYQPTRTLPLRFTVRYQDQTPGARVMPPKKCGRPKSTRMPETCATAGCGLQRTYLDGYCKSCHDRHEYWSKPDLRERKRLASIASGRARRARARRERQAA